MISASKFYSGSKRKVSSFRLLSQAKDHAENKQTRNIVILPPALSSTTVDSETEEVPRDKFKKKRKSNWNLSRKPHTGSIGGFNRYKGPEKIRPRNI